MVAVNRFSPTRCESEGEPVCPCGGSNDPDPCSLLPYYAALTVVTVTSFPGPTTTTYGTNNPNGIWIQPGSFGETPLPWRISPEAGAWSIRSDQLENHAIAADPETGQVERIHAYDFQAMQTGAAGAWLFYDRDIPSGAGGRIIRSVGGPSYFNEAVGYFEDGRGRGPLFTCIRNTGLPQGETLNPIDGECIKPDPDRMWVRFYFDVHGYQTPGDYVEVRWVSNSAGTVYWQLMSLVIGGAIVDSRVVNLGGHQFANRKYDMAPAQYNEEDELVCKGYTVPQFYMRGPIAICDREATGGKWRLTVIAGDSFFEEGAPSGAGTIGGVPRYKSYLQGFRSAPMTGGFGIRTGEQINSITMRGIVVGQKDDEGNPQQENIFYSARPFCDNIEVARRGFGGFSGTQCYGSSDADPEPDPPVPWPLFTTITLEGFQTLDGEQFSTGGNYDIDDFPEGYNCDISGEYLGLPQGEHAQWYTSDYMDFDGNYPDIYEGTPNTFVHAQLFIADQLPFINFPLSDDPDFTDPEEVGVWAGLDRYGAADGWNVSRLRYFYCQSDLPQAEDRDCSLTGGYEADVCRRIFDTGFFDPNVTVASPCDDFPTRILIEAASAPWTPTPDPVVPAEGPTAIGCYDYEVLQGTTLAADAPKHRVAPRHMLLTFGDYPEPLQPCCNNLSANAWVLEFQDSTVNSNPGQTEWRLKPPAGILDCQFPCPDGGLPLRTFRLADIRLWVRTGLLNSNYINAAGVADWLSLSVDDPVTEIEVRCVWEFIGSGGIAAQTQWREFFDSTAIGTAPCLDIADLELQGYVDRLAGVNPAELARFNYCYAAPTGCDPACGPPRPSGTNELTDTRPLVPVTVSALQP